jgi:transposase InsO family protein
MAGKVVSMKVISSVIAKAEGAEVNVARVCAQAGVSRQFFSDQLARYRCGGLEGLEPKSRRPLSSPNATGLEVQERIVKLRKELSDAGLDHGATTIQWHLGRATDLNAPVPAVSTIHRILVERGQVTAQPKKRPKTSWRRFEAPRPNEWWQIDAMDWVIATGLVKIFNVVDDHSRVAARSRCVNQATTDEAWTTFCQAAQVFGLPAGVLSDNGLCFSGKLRGFEVLFESKLRDAGIRPFNGRPYHPQTTGKVERFQQTLKKWLRKQPLAADLAELQAQLDEFCRIYNHERPHQGISRQIPIERFRASTPATPAAEPLEHPMFAGELRNHAQADNRGNVHVNNLTINIGSRYAGCDTVVITDTTHASVFINDHLVRHLTIDPTRTYQPSGNKRGGPHQQRIAS